MRFQVRASSPEIYERLLPLLRGRTDVYTASARRLMVSTGALDADLQRKIEEMGARVAPDRQFTADSLPG